VGRRRGGVHGADGQRSLFWSSKAESFVAEGLLKTPEGKTQAVRSLVEIIAKVRDEIPEEFLYKRLQKSTTSMNRSSSASWRRSSGGKHAPGRFSGPGERRCSSAEGDDSPSPAVPPSPAMKCYQRGSSDLCHDQKRSSWPCLPPFPRLKRSLQLRAGMVNQHRRQVVGRQHRIGLPA